MNIYEETVAKIVTGRRELVVIGLGYVGIQLACAFAERDITVVGVDVDERRVEAYRSGADQTDSVSAHELGLVKKFTTNYADIDRANVGAYVICVPTPVDRNGTPVYDYVNAATASVAELLKPGDVVVYESTVGPGTTNRCASTLMTTCSDVAVGFSPERLQPGVRGKRTVDLPKIVSGVNEESAAAVTDLYEIILNRQILHVASSTTTAELTKLLENVKRDVNIALVNEFAKIADYLGVDVNEVIDLAETKPNFNNDGYRPGLVGGHCVSVDPHYLYPTLHRAKISSSIVRQARHVNELHPHWVAKRFAELVKANGCGRCVVLGASFKENCADVREAKVWETVATLRDVYGLSVTVVDPLVDDDVVARVYGQSVVVDVPEHTEALLVAVGHDVFKRKFSEIVAKLDGPRLVVDLKSTFRWFDVSGVNYVQL